MNETNWVLAVCFFGWIPLLALGKCIAMIIEAIREKHDKGEA
jgi:hypothetical protein